MARLLKGLKNRVSEEDEATISDILDAVRTVFLVASISYQA
jgi:hypothetical protein